MSEPKGQIRQRLGMTTSHPQQRIVITVECGELTITLEQAAAMLRCVAWVKAVKTEGTKLKVEFEPGATLARYKQNIINTLGGYLRPAH